MADLQTKLRWLAERGNPVGAEELIERIEAELAGDPLVVVAKRREGTLMTKTQPPPTTQQPSRSRGPTWAVAAFVAVLAAGVLYLAFSNDEEPVADVPPPPTTVAPDVETMTDLEVIEAGVAAFYGGDAQRAVELFDLADRTDDEIRDEAAYQAAIDGRLTLECRQASTPGQSFSCRVPYHNALTDAIGYVDSGDTNRVVVEDGVITEFGFPEHSFIVVEIGVFLAMEGRFDGYEDCNFGPFPESCAAIQLENLDSWLEWQQTRETVDVVTSALESWYGGDCETARFLAGLENELCSTPDTANETIEYEAILEADVSVEGCEEAPGSVDQMVFTCEVHYSNVQNTAVGKPPNVTSREFRVHEIGFLDFPDDPSRWYLEDYPEDPELRESFRLFAESGDLAGEYAAADCANTRSPECANLIRDNLDDWAAWYETSG